MKVFSFSMKVVVSNDEGREIVECLGNARSSKKAAAEDAAEGALWCLKHMGISWTFGFINLFIAIFLISVEKDEEI